MEKISYEKGKVLIKNIEINWLLIDPDRMVWDNKEPVEEFNFWMDKLTKNNAQTAIVYAWQGEQWGIKDKPVVLEYIKNY